MVLISNPTLANRLEGKRGRASARRTPRAKNTSKLTCCTSTCARASRAVSDAKIKSNSRSAATNDYAPAATEKATNQALVLQ